jgi:hypothetical protein
MTPETAVALVLAAGARLDVEGEALVLDVPSEHVRDSIPPEAVAVLRAHKQEAMRIVRGIQERERERGGPFRFPFACCVCGELFPDGAPGESLLRTPDGWTWPRCPACTSAGRAR